MFEFAEEHKNCYKIDWQIVKIQLFFPSYPPLHKKQYLLCLWVPKKGLVRKLAWKVSFLPNNWRILVYLANLWTVGWIFSPFHHKQIPTHAYILSIRARKDVDDQHEQIQHRSFLLLVADVPIRSLHFCWNAPKQQIRGNLTQYFPAGKERLLKGFICQTTQTYHQFLFWIQRKRSWSLQCFAQKFGSILL